jgi:hypothetical protein
VAAYATKAGSSPSKSLMICHIMLQDQSRVVRLPVNVYELLSKITKVGNHLNAQPDRQKPATYAEIGESSMDAQHMSACCATEHVCLLQCACTAFIVYVPGIGFCDAEIECVSALTLCSVLALQRGRWTCRWRR